MDERMERTFSVGADASLTLENIVGNIRISSWERPEIHVVAVQRSRTKAEIEMVQDGDHVTIRTYSHWVGSFLRWLGGERPPVVDYTVEVPAYCRIRVSAVDGAATLSGLRPETRLSLVSGQAQVEALEGDLEFNLVSTPQGHYHFHTVSGDVVLAVPPGTRSTAIGESVSGRVRSDLPASVERQGFGSWRATVNGGGVEIRFNSVSGDLILMTENGRRAMEMASVLAAEAPPPSPEPPMTTMDVLKAVESGQLSVEEALKQLNKSP